MENFVGKTQRPNFKYKKIDYNFFLMCHCHIILFQKYPFIFLKQVVTLTTNNSIITNYSPNIKHLKKTITMQCNTMQ